MSVAEIQVVWSDTSNEVPYYLLNEHKNSQINFEVHENNSLNNRFRPISSINTESVLTIDDDMVISCAALQQMFEIWNSNKRALVGVSPRMHAIDAESGDPRYLRWQHSWWNGYYSIMLTKATFMHKDYLFTYNQQTPPKIIQYIDNHRNCEDIAMAHMVAKITKAPPVWVKITVHESSEAGISSNPAHFKDRSKCLSIIREVFGKWEWMTGQQKMIQIDTFDFLSLWFDNK